MGVPSIPRFEWREVLVAGALFTAVACAPTTSDRTSVTRRRADTGVNAGYSARGQANGHPTPQGGLETDLLHALVHLDDILWFAQMLQPEFRVGSNQNPDAGGVTPSEDATTRRDPLRLQIAQLGSCASLVPAGNTTDVFLLRLNECRRAVTRQQSLVYSGEVTVCRGSSTQRHCGVEGAEASSAALRLMPNQRLHYRIEDHATPTGVPLNPVQVRKLELMVQSLAATEAHPVRFRLRASRETRIERAGARAPQRGRGQEGGMSIPASPIQQLAQFEVPSLELEASRLTGSDPQAQARQFRLPEQGLLFRVDESGGARNEGSLVEMRLLPAVEAPLLEVLTACDQRMRLTGSVRVDHQRRNRTRETGVLVLDRMGYQGAPGTSQLSLRERQLWPGCVSADSAQLNERPNQQ